MKLLKIICSTIGFVMIFGILLAAILLLIYNPSIYWTQPYLLIHYFGICVLVMIIAFKLSDYCALFLNPHKSLLFTVIQFVLLPFIVSFLVSHFQLPPTIALAIGCAALSPGNMAKNLFKNLFMALCIFFVSLYILPASSTTVNEIYETTTSSHTKIVLLIIALSIFAIYEIRAYQNKKKDQPDEVYYIEEH